MPKRKTILGGPGRGEGNPLIPPPAEETLEKVSRIPKRKMHFFTWNNHTDEQVGGLLTYFDKHAVKYRIQEEKGESGTPHLQGCVMFNTEQRSTVWDKDSKGHWEAIKGKWEDAVKYCRKIETRFGREWEKGLPKPLKLISPTKWWQTEILELIDSEPDDRKVHWYWSRAGSIGKSQFAKYCVFRKNCLFFEEGKKSDIMHLIFEAPEERLECMIIDVPRDNGNNISYKAIESIKNGMIYSPKYEGGYKLFNSPHIIVFANQPPQQERLSEDRWVITNIDEDDEFDENERIGLWDMGLIP